MRTYQEFITEIRRFRLRRSGGDPFTRYSDGKQKPIDLSAIHAAGNADAKASVGYKEKRLKQYRNQETARRMDAAGKKLGLPEEVELDEGMTLADYKKQKSRQKQKDKREALKTSPTRRKGIHNPSASPERAARHRTNVDPDFEGDDESNYPGGRLRKNKEAKARALGELGEENVQELFITKLTPEQKRKKKVETLIRLMQHAKDPSADVAKTKKEDYELDETIRNPESRKKLRAIMDREVEKGDKSKGQNPRRKYLTKKGDQAFGLLMSRDETGSKNNPVRKRGGTNAPADERVGKGPHRAGNAAYWASVAGPTRDRGAGNKAARRAGKSVSNTRDDD